MHRAGHSSAVNQKSWQQGDTAEEDQAPDPSHRWKEHYLFCLLTHLLLLQNQDQHQGPQTFQTFSKKKKKEKRKEFQSWAQSRKPIHSHSLSLFLPPNPSLYSHYCGVWDYFILFVEWPPSFSFNSSIFFSLGRKKGVAVSQRGLQPKLLKAGTELYIWILVLFCFASPAKLYTLHLFFFFQKSLFRNSMPLFSYLHRFLKDKFKLLETHNIFHREF